MCNVYANCWLNIAATSASDGSKGLFTNRSFDDEMHPTIVEWGPPSLDGSQACFLKYVLEPSFFADRKLREAPLNKRGWVLQERYLSPRILHFASGQVLWECNTSILCERFPRALPPWLRNSCGNFSTLQYAAGHHLRYKSPSSSNISDLVDGEWYYQLWSSIVYAYSRSALSFGSDKLIAIAGLAKVMEQLLQDRYVVGLWEKYFVSQLLWKVAGLFMANGSTTKPSHRPAPHRAPTWSWLSLDAEIQVSQWDKTDNLFIELLDLRIDEAATGNAPFTCRGALVIKGRLRPLQIRRFIVKPADIDPEFFESAMVSGRSPKPGEFDAEIRGQYVLTVGGVDLQLPSAADGTVGDKPVVSLDVPYVDVEASSRARSLFLMPAAGPWAGKDEHFHEMLILDCKDSQQGMFHRLGIATLDTKGCGSLLDYVSERDECEASLPCVTYHPEEHAHVIRLE